MKRHNVDVQNFEIIENLKDARTVGDKLSKYKRDFRYFLY